MIAMDITAHARILPLNDPDGALAFYPDTLRSEVRNDIGYGGIRWITASQARRFPGFPFAFAQKNTPERCDPQC